MDFQKQNEKEKISSKRTNFLRNVVPLTNGNVIEIRSFDKNGKPTQKYFNNHSDALNYTDTIKNDNNVYFGIAARKDSSSGNKENCSTLSALFIDIDYGTAGHKKQTLFSSFAEVKKHFLRIKFPRPSYIVSSGHGVHIYWLLKEPIELNESTKPELENVMKRIGYFYGGDSTQNIDRIFRVPYSFNLKGTDPVESTINHTYLEQKYDLNNFYQNELYNVPIEKIFSTGKNKDQYYNALFNSGTNEWGKPSNSEIDQALITVLFSKGFTNHQIELIFQNFPTTGKYFEHKASEKYLAHSIMNAEEHMVLNSSSETQDHGAGDTSESKYIVDDTSGKCGYYMPDNDKIIRLSNFIINFKSRVLLVRDHEPRSYFTGDIILQTGEVVSVDMFDAGLLADPRALSKFIANYCGTKASILGSSKDFVEAVKNFNIDIPELKEVEFGYNKDLTVYTTEDMVITKDGIKDSNNVIKYSENWGSNHLGFKKVNNDELNNIKKSIINKFFHFDLFKVTLILFAVSLTPIIHPFTRSDTPYKYYLVLKGQSGAGKTVLGRSVLRFFADVQHLISVTSTANYITIAGSAFKDAAFVIDDLKKENFAYMGDINRFTAMLQNYSDENGRGRANKDQSLRDERIIEGQLIIPTEDFPITQPSTIARGIIVAVPNKEYIPDLFSEMEEISKQFNGFTPGYIQYVLANYNINNLCSLLYQNKIWLNSQLTNMNFEVSYDNLARCINNFAKLKTSWDVVSGFLFEDAEEKNKYDAIFRKDIVELLINNLDRINESKQELKFEEALWDLVESRKLFFDSIYNSDPYPNKGHLIGFYEKTDGGIKIALNLKNAYRDVSKEVGDLGITYETLRDRLVKQGKIRIPGSGRDPKVSFSRNNKRRGVEWIGKFPKEPFGLKEEEDQPTEEKVEELKPGSPIQANVTNM